MHDRPKDYWNKRAGIFAAVTIILAWVIGYAINQTPSPICKHVLPEAELCKPLGEDTLEGVIQHDDDTETVVGWSIIREAPGYAGPIRVMVGVSSSGELSGVYVITHSETPAYFDKIIESGFTEKFVGIQANSPFELGDGIEAVSRATITSRAINDAVREASYTIAETQLGYSVEREEELVQFGVPEIALISLYLIGYFGHQGGFKYKKIVRWMSLLAGLFILGFAYNLPLTVTHINSLLLGFFPNWRNNLYWFLLVGGIFLVVTVDNKNPYCQWFCPFGAAQECLGAIGGARVWSPGRKLRQNLQWMQRGLAWSAIVLGLIMRKPGFSSYEIYGALFSLTGSWPQWVILVIIILMSLFIKRPWCNYLCPMDPIVDFIQAARRWSRQGFRRWKNKINTEQNS